MTITESKLNLFDYDTLKLSVLIARLEAKMKLILEANLGQWSLELVHPMVERNGECR